MEGKNEEASSVGVALRVRPLSGKEIAEGSRVIIKVDQALKLITIDDRPFTFDQVFGIESRQQEIFDGCVKQLVQTIFNGYNATILAYGQTGSGKTFTMGSGKLANIDPEDLGIIPRVITMIFAEIDSRKQNGEFVVKINFIEIYNEEIHDLLNQADEKNLAIRERAGSIVIDGLCEELVVDADGTFKCLEDGTLQRSVSSTLMNSQSSRSHAIFTINIDYQGKEEDKWTTKFHFVDLAGSERAKRTGASGATLKEGISINKGLLCLGNVISALTDESKKSSHIPYRDSKLTRILQDSLGGNANTYMIACASPAESNFEETLNTLKYASRARNIKNKPVVNVDPHSAMIALLKGEIASLKNEIQTYQSILSGGSDDMKAALDEIKKNSAVRPEIGEELTTHKAQQMDKRLAMITSELDQARSAFTTLEIENLKLKKDRDLMKFRLDACIEKLAVFGVQVPEEEEKSVSLVDEYLETIEKLKKEKDSQTKVIKDLEYEYSNLMKELERDRKLLDQRTAEIEKSKRRGPERESQKIEYKIEEYSRMFAESILQTMSTSQAEVEEIQEVNEEVAQEIQEQEEILSMQKEEICLVEDKIKEKEDKLKNIEGAFKEIQNKILEEMNNQYYIKIEQISSELKQIEHERDLALEKSKNSTEQKATSDKFKTKIQDLESQLQEYIRKNKHLQSLEKELENQKSKLVKMNEEVKREKKQKVDMQNKFKKEKDELVKIKAIRAKELMNLKRNNVKKDQEIKVLKAENRKKEIVAKRKTEELAALHKRQRDIALKRKNSGLVAVDALKEWVKDYVKACIAEQGLQRTLQKEENDKTEIEEDLQDLYTSYSSLKNQVDKNEMILTDHDPNVDLDELYMKIQEGKSEIGEILDQIEILEEKVIFKQNKIIEIQTELVNSKVEDIKSKAENMTSGENTQSLIKVLFDEYLNKSLKYKSAKGEIGLKESQNYELREIIDQVSLEKKLIQKNFESELKILHSKLLEKTEIIFKISEDLKDDQSAEKEDLLEENKKYKEKLDYYINRYTKLLRAYKDVKDNEYDKSKPRASFVPGSLSQARDIRKYKKIVETEEKMSTPRISCSFTKFSQSIKAIEDDAVFDRLQKPLSRSRTSLQPEYCLRPKQKWEQINTTEAHEGSVTSLLATESMMFTASNQKLKIWNLENFEYVGEISAHSSFIKSLAYFNERNALFSSCGGVVNCYDSLTLTKITSFKGHNDEIRTMKICENYLICAGKGSPNSITFWDVRKIDQPVAEKEKNLDIFSLVFTENTLFYGCRDHKVHRMRLSDLEPLKPFEPGHYDSVISLGLIEDLLISGSRDKNLRIWDFESSQEIKTIITAHTDWVNCITSDYFGRAFYTGGKEGKIKVWEACEGDVNLSGELSGHTGSVTCLASIPTNFKCVVSASADKTFRVWKNDELQYSE